jgi:hypothetical protein
MSSISISKSEVSPSCVEALVNSICTIQESIGGDKEKALKIQRVLEFVPHHLTSHIFVGYYKKIIQIQESMQISLGFAFEDEDLQSANTCESCGNQDAIDMEIIKKNVVSHIADRIKWRVPEDILQVFLNEVQFGPDLICSYHHFNKRYNKYFGVTSIAYSVKQFLIKHECNLENGIIYGLLLTEELGYSSIQQMIKKKFQ